MRVEDAGSPHNAKEGEWREEGTRMEEGKRRTGREREWPRTMERQKSKTKLEQLSYILDMQELRKYIFFLS